MISYGVAPLQVRGLKHIYFVVGYWFTCRTFTGAWIETIFSGKMSGRVEVAPLQVRGLKPLRQHQQNRQRRRTFTGAWIETILNHP